MASIEADKRREAMIVDDSVRRRWWLLTEAIKQAPLREALEIACAAEAFLAGEAAGPALHQQPAPSSREAERSSENETSGASASPDMPQYLH